MLTARIQGSSMLLTVLRFVSLFLTALLHWDQGLPISLIFIACMGSLSVSLATFIYDIHLSLLALKMELVQVKPDLA